MGCVMQKHAETANTQVHDWHHFHIYGYGTAFDEGFVELTLLPKL